MAALSGDKGTTPLPPPLSGGARKSNPPSNGQEQSPSTRWRASPFYTPLLRGGRGGCFSIREGFSSTPENGLFHRAFSSGCPTPSRGPVEKPHKRSVLNFTPPLRGSRGSRAVCAKADAVGGAFPLWHVPPPARLRASPSPCRRSSPRETDPQGGSEKRFGRTRRSAPTEPFLLILSRRVSAVSKA